MTATATEKPRVKTDVKSSPKAAPKAITNLWAFSKETQNMIVVEMMWGDRKITNYVPKEWWQSLGSPSGLNITLTSGY